VTPTTSQQFERSDRYAPSEQSRQSWRESVQFLEDRFACAQACTECARVCALRASDMDPEGTGEQARLRRKGSTCAEVCDATCLVLSEQLRLDERGIRAQVEWCRAVCLECAEFCEDYAGAEDAAKACRECAQACADFLATLNWGTGSPKQLPLFTERLKESDPVRRAPPHH
jgi:hypothetical protein